MVRIENGIIVNDVESGGTPILTPTSFNSPQLQTPSWLSSVIPPDLKLHSVSSILIIVQIAMYFVSTLVVPPRGWIEPTNLALLRIGSGNSLGLSCAACGYVLELRRLIVPIFLHLGILHILLNVFFQLSMSPRFESMLGSPGKFLTLFIGSGVVGNLVSAARGSNGSGASTACYGLLGAEYLCEYIAWPSLTDGAQKEAVKQRLIRQTAFLLMWEFVNWETVGHFAHLGGFIGGGLIFALVRNPASDREDRLQRTSRLALAVIVAACWVLIWLPVAVDFDNNRDVCSGFLHQIYR